MKTMTQVNWGIIGCGDVTEIKSGPAFNKVKDSRLVAVMRRDAHRAQDYAERHGVQLQLGECPQVQVRVDAMRLQQVLSNLLSNAAKGRLIDFLFLDHGNHIGQANTFNYRRLDRELKEAIDDVCIGGLGYLLAYKDPRSDWGKGDVKVINVPYLDVYACSAISITAEPY